MDYIESLVYTEIVTRIQNNTAWFTSNNLVAPASIEYFTQQYQSQDKNNSWKRPAIFVEFGEAEWQHRSGFQKVSQLPIMLHVVQDVMIKGRAGAAQQDKFKDLLNYPYIVNELFDNWKGSCFKKLQLVGSKPDHDTDNLLVKVLEYESTIVLKRDPAAPN